MMRMILPTAPSPKIDILPETRRWTIEEFERAIDAGMFGPEERLELIDGEIIEKMTQNGPHATGTTLSGDALRALCPADSHIRIQLPLNLGTGRGNRPEPDVALVNGSPRQYAATHPTSATLVIEVADATLAYDRAIKAGQYAQAGIAEYWIVNIPDRLLEVHRQPAPMAGEPFGHHYRNIVRHTDVEAVTPLFAPSSYVRVADLLP